MAPFFEVKAYCFYTITELSDNLILKNSVGITLRLLYLQRIVVKVSFTIAFV
ncbi:MAG: hypothetical protein AMXMBFR12_01430 [Candidatus Babeliales bacterium]